MSEAGTIARVVNMRPLRIAIVTETFLPKMDGVVRSIVEFLRYLRRNGHDAIVFCPGSGEPVAEGFPVVYAGGSVFPLYPELRLAVRCPMMLPRMRAWKPDIVHLAGPALLGVQGLRVARLCRVPAIAHFQTDLATYARHYGARWLEPAIWRYLIGIHNRCAANYAPTAAVEGELLRRGMERVRILGRGVDTRTFHPGYRSGMLRQSWGVDPTDVVFLSVGRVSAEKNLDRLSDLMDGLPNSKLVVVGDGPYRSTLARRLGPSVIFTGQSRGAALSTAYASADVFAFPSLTDTFGQVLQEAMASGLPVLAMRAGGTPEIIDDGATGLLCRPSAPGAWVDNARFLARSRDVRLSLGARARSVAEMRSWGATFDGLMDAYRVLAGHHLRLLSPRSGAPGAAPMSSSMYTRWR